MMSIKRRLVHLALASLTSVALAACSKASNCQPPGPSRQA